MNQCYDSDEYAEINLAVSGLITQAHHLSQQHLRDPSVQFHFQQHYSQIGQYLINRYENGEISKESLVDQIKREAQSLLDQSGSIFKYGVGLAAGLMQVYGGVGICVGGSAETFGTACYFIGAPLIAHGANNVYENGYNLLNLGAENAVGFLRHGYREAANLLGYGDTAGDLAYGG
ncbi:DUF4225 domain-containing protein (plasmid) [Photobacterium sp. GJ3]|uniref:DUF4225 domain-containing protein n=1 Tax=Photobacterium sp. GJ3 TaxID=2829502 RepID=UPI001B8ACA12|nr:DUF4225 domain-containing protein [Photobacterium sp. GJ3]QUJ69698.1 DUF4225 domain-containing protein [Photobacterium sp. GJ3]